MKTTFLTDGGAEALALARWAAQRGIDARVIEARGESDLRHLVEHRRRLPEGSLVVLSSGEALAGDVDARKAWKVAAEWLRPLTPMDRRALGAGLLDEAVRKQSPGAEALLSFLTALGLPSKSVGRVGASRPGRPKTGKDPFRGTGFDVCTALLAEPRGRWTERALAAAAGRSNSAVHGVAVELVRRGLLEKSQTGWLVPRPEVLLESFAEAWRVRTGVPREATGYAWNGKGSALEQLRRVALSAQTPWLLAGPSATEELVGGPLVVYAQETLHTALLAAHFQPASTRRADLIVWEPLEAGLFRSPRPVGEGLLATNPVVTCLDLLAGGSARERQVAMGLWQEMR